MPEACRPLGPINIISQNRRMKNQDPNENNARKMNIPTLLESPVLDELIVLVETHVLTETQVLGVMEVLEEALGPNKAQKFKNKEKSTNYTYSKKMCDCNEIVVNIVFSFKVANEITNDFELKLSMDVDKGMISLNENKQFKEN